MGIHSLGRSHSGHASLRTGSLSEARSLRDLRSPTPSCSPPPEDAVSLPQRRHRCLFVHRRRSRKFQRGAARAGFLFGPSVRLWPSLPSHGSSWIPMPPRHFVTVPPTPTYSLSTLLNKNLEGREGRADKGDMGDGSLPPFLSVSDTQQEEGRGSKLPRKRLMRPDGSTVAEVPLSPQGVPPVSLRDAAELERCAVEGDVDRARRLLASIQLSAGGSKEGIVEGLVIRLCENGLFDRACDVALWEETAEVPSASVLVLRELLGYILRSRSPKGRWIAQKGSLPPSKIDAVAATLVLRAGVPEVLKDRSLLELFLSLTSDLQEGGRGGVSRDVMDVVERARRKREREQGLKRRSQNGSSPPLSIVRQIPSPQALRDRGIDRREIVKFHAELLKFVLESERIDPALLPEPRREGRDATPLGRYGDALFQALEEAGVSGDLQLPVINEWLKGLARGGERMAKLVEEEFEALEVEPDSETFASLITARGRSSASPILYARQTYQRCRLLFPNPADALDPLIAFFDVLAADSNEGVLAFICAKEAWSEWSESALRSSEVSGAVWSEAVERYARLLSFIGRSSSECRPSAAKCLSDLFSSQGGKTKVRSLSRQTAVAGVNLLVEDIVCSVEGEGSSALREGETSPPGLFTSYWRAAARLMDLSRDFVVLASQAGEGGGASELLRPLDCAKQVLEDFQELEAPLPPRLCAAALMLFAECQKELQGSQAVWASEVGWKLIRRLADEEKEAIAANSREEEGGFRPPAAALEAGIAFLSSSSRSTDVGRAVSLLGFMKKQGRQPRPLAYSAVLRALQLTPERWKDSLRILRGASVANVKLGNGDLEAVLSTLCVGLGGRAAEYFESVVDDASICGVVPSSLCFRRMLSCVASREEGCSVDRVMRILNKMRETRVEVDSACALFVLQGLSRAPAGGFSWDFLRKMVEVARRGFDVSFYETFFACLERLGKGDLGDSGARAFVSDVWAEAQEVLEEHEVKKLVGRFETVLSAFLDVVETQQETPMMESLIVCLAEKEKGSALDLAVTGLKGRVKEMVAVSVEVVGAVLRALEGAGRGPDLLVLARYLREEGALTDPSLLRLYLQCLCREGSPEGLAEADSLLRELNDAGNSRASDFAEVVGAMCRADMPWWDVTETFWNFLPLAAAAAERDPSGQTEGLPQLFCAALRALSNAPGSAAATAEARAIRSEFEKRDRPEWREYRVEVFALLSCVVGKGGDLDDFLRLRLRIRAMAASDSVGVRAYDCAFEFLEQVLMDRSLEDSERDLWTSRLWILLASEKLPLTLETLRLTAMLSRNVMTDRAVQVTRAAFRRLSLLPNPVKLSDSRLQSVVSRQTSACLKSLRTRPEGCGWVEGERILGDAERLLPKGEFLSIEAYTALLLCYRAASVGPQWHRAVDLLRSLASRGFFLSEGLSSSDLQRLYERVMSVLTGRNRSESTKQTCLKKFRWGRPREILQIRQFFEQSLGLEATPVIFAHHMWALLNQRWPDVPAAVQLLEEAEKRGFVPHSLVMRVMLNIAEQTADVESARVILENLHAYGYAKMRHVDKVLRVCSVARWGSHMSTAVEVLRWAAREGILNPGPLTCKNLFLIASQGVEHEEYDELAEECVRCARDVNFGYEEPPKMPTNGPALQAYKAECLKSGILLSEVGKIEKFFRLLGIDIWSVMGELERLSWDEGVEKRRRERKGEEDWDGEIGEKQEQRKRVEGSSAMLDDLVDHPS
uniref:Pentacotripeptide-repeat region of PRORP domain-containing protein n=1 Tax=Chromera velia CCMP2878 TaxID=1169474 RepID=A0A0G4GQK8_9ALVE|eukprot:Cvel_22938.t1-p1 / transcript=Cvel_22938.t1 / gene=Cvel_22938 / organism=Chromera_velia_CCMP2878 / gene_product=hypothetical protein / transcript_product=hypothetical protein / location=Cvel_scaffold2308:23512-29157(-) / protein_length=1727 / sequence_SO=supercontig / SO=protein_coding / is_pseudo=false